jgi:hypothetical protein
MKIISKFKDFYDHVVDPSMIDPSIKWVRNTKTYFPSKEEMEKLPSQDYKVDRSITISFEQEHRSERKYVQGWLVIADKAHPIWMLANKNFEFSTLEDMVPSQRDAPIHYLGICGENFLDLIKRWTKENGHKLFIPATNHNRQDKAEIEMGNRFQQQDLTNFSLAMGTPLYLLLPTHIRGDYWAKGKWAVVKNPMLNMLYAQLVFQPYEIWQSCMQFIGGVMPGQQSPMVSLTDTEIRDKHGFDPTWGFRKRPSLVKE